MCLGNSEQFVCGVQVKWYADQPKGRGVSWCVRSRAAILRAIVANQCLPNHVAHPDFEARFLPDVRAACNMAHGGDFARVIRPEFDRLVRHYAKTWVTNDAYGPIVLTNTIVVNGEVGKEYRFNRELVERCFNDVDAVERWLRVEMGKQDWWDKASDPDPTPSTPVATPKRPTPTMPTTPVTQSRRRAGTASSTPTGRSRRPPQTPKRGPSSADMNSLASSVEALSFPAASASASQTPSTPTRCPPPSGLFSDSASGLAGGVQMPAAESPVPAAKDGTPALGPALWRPGPTGPTTPRAVAPNPGIFPPTPARSLASARAPSTAPPSSARWVFPSSSSSSSSPGPRHPPAPTTILTDGTRVAPSTFVSSSVRSYAPSSLPSSPATRYPPPPTTILTDGASIAPSTVASSAVPLPSIHSSLPGRFRESFRPPPPPPTTILTAGVTDVEAAAAEHAHHYGDDDGNGSGGHGVGVGVEDGAETWETWEDRVRESFEATRLAWRYVVEVETAAKAIMFGIDGPV